MESNPPAWAAPASEHGYAREVTDRMSHFWLVDQPVGEDWMAIAESSPAFRDWVTEFARVCGDFLDTTESFGPEILKSFIDNAPEYRVGESLVDGVAGRLPLPAAVANVPAVSIKGTHRYGTIEQLLEGSRYADSFAGGTFVHLPACAYHRFHLPVSGRIAESFLIGGPVDLQVEIDDHRLVCRDDAETGYQFFQTRGVVTIDTSESAAGDVGIVAVVCVGLSHVGSSRSGSPAAAQISDAVPGLRSEYRGRHRGAVS